MKYSKVVAFAAVAQAAQLPVPTGGEVGQLHFPLTCTALGGAFTTTLDSILTATAPLTAQEGQKIYYTDITAALTIPASLVQAAGIIGTSYANTFVKVNLALTNASPNPYPVFPNGYWVNKTAFNPFGGTVVRLPAGGNGVLPDVGPVTVGRANTTHTISIGAITADVYLYNAQGGLIFGPLSLSCPQQTPATTVGVVNILPATGTQGTALAPKNGFKPNFPAIGSGQEYGCFNFAYNCAFGFFQFVFDVVSCGGVNSQVAPSGSFYLENVTAAITLPQGLVDATRNLYAGATTIDTRVNGFYITTTNAQPAALNAFPNGYYLNGTKIPPSGNLTLYLPPSGVLRIGPFTATGPTGSAIGVGIGNTTTSSTIRNSTGANIGQADFICRPPTTNFQIVNINIASPTSSGVPSLALPSFAGPTFALPTFGF